MPEAIDLDPTRKVGGLPIWAWGAGGAALLIWALRHGAGYANEGQQDPGAKAGRQGAAPPVEPQGPGGSRRGRHHRGSSGGGGAPGEGETWGTGGGGTGGAFHYGGMTGEDWKGWGGPGPWDSYGLDFYFPGIDLWGSPGGSAPPADGGGSSGLGSQALAAGMAYLGCPYRFGGTACHPGIDCSGLTMRAWGAVGVKLPHFSGAQYFKGTAVPKGQWVEGDLLFFFHPIHHVAMYAGGNRILTANHVGQPVHVESLEGWMGLYVGARRPG